MQTFTSITLNMHISTINKKTAINLLLKTKKCDLLVILLIPK